MLEEPQGKYYSAEVAAPLFAKVMSQALGILRVAPREQQVPATVLAEAPAPRAPRYPSGVVAVARRALNAGDGATEDSAEAAGRTPSALGMSARQALAVFARLGILARLQGTGFVVAQDPPPGSPVRPGSVHTLFLADDAAAPGRAAERRAEETAPPPSAP